MNTLIFLAVFSGLSSNLVLQFGLGMGGISAKRDKGGGPLFPFQLGLLFAAVLLLWAFFIYIVSPLGLGLFEYVLLFPLSAVVCIGLELLTLRLFPRLFSPPPLFNPVSAYEGLAVVSLLLTLHLAVSFVEAAVLSLGFSLGIFLSILILNEIRRRSVMEMVPDFLRGSPLVLISMGLLSLIFSSLTGIFLKILCVF
jgi:electron transport complex protein RnfA